MTTMPAGRDGLYRFPWSTTDSQSGWVEVTDRCDMACLGCYRKSLEGPRRFEDVARDIVACQGLTNCDSLSIAGGEPLTYPRLTDVVRFIAQRGMKPVLLTNGLKLTPSFAAELKRAGLAKIHFHVDANQNRPGWEGRSETEMNALRQRYAELTRALGGVQCGYNVTVTRRTLEELPAVLRWCRENHPLVQHVSVIAFRSIPVGAGTEYRVRGRPVDPSGGQYATTHTAAIDITTEEMLDVLRASGFDLAPSAFLNGTTRPRSLKYLIGVSLGSAGGAFGHLGPRSMELVQVGYHLLFGRYCSFLRNPVAGHKVFLLAALDPEVRRAASRYLRQVARRPWRLFERVYTQTIHLQQPNEVLAGAINLCDDCANAMVHADRLISSCRWDEFRLYGGLLTPVPAAGTPRRGEPCL
jgi:hypothetical protein